MKKDACLEKQRKSRSVAIFVVAVVLVAASVSLFVQWRLSQVSAGVCVKQGRVLSEEELRQAVLQSLVDYEVENASIYNYGTESSRTLHVGIIRNPEEQSVPKLMEQAFLGEKSFKENFGIEDIYQDFDWKELKVPFILIKYISGSQGIAGLYITTEIQRIDNPEQIDTLSNKYKPNLYEQLQGYGKYYFRILEVAIQQDCCGNEVPMEKKEEIYKSSLSILNSSLSLATPRYITPVSNCGELLTFQGQGTVFNFHSITWIQGE
ncbi:MAG: hypothetical protein LBU53_01755 [Zoogloeaceae bacterium]|nr:hypothetical protein [Zoogloeaceae bacterium]